MPPVLRSRKETVELVNRASQKVSEIFDRRGTLAYQKGMKATLFLKSCQEIEVEDGSIVGLDLKEMVRAPRDEDLRRYLLAVAPLLLKIRITMTGPVSQDFFIVVLKKASQLKQLELKLPTTNPKVQFQKDLMDVILAMRLEVLVMLGSFNCVHLVKPPLSHEPTIRVIRCPGNSKARNNFVDVLLDFNQSTIVQLELRDDLTEDTKKKAAALPELCVLGVEHFSDMWAIEGLSPHVIVLVRGSPKETAAEACRAITSIASCGSGSFLRETQSLALMGYQGPSMCQVLKAVGKHLVAVDKLALIGWDERHHALLETLKDIPRLKRLKFKFCFRLNPAILEAISHKEMLPNLRSLTVEMSSFLGLTPEQAHDSLLNIGQSRPNIELTWASC